MNNQPTLSPLLPQLFTVAIRRPSAKAPTIGFILAHTEQLARKSAKMAYSEQSGTVPTVEACRALPTATLALATDGKRYRVSITIEEVS